MRLPYLSAIDSLKKIRRHETPLNKMRVVCSLSKVILGCVDEFWQGMEISKDQLTIDADMLLSIFTFIASKSHLTELFGHIRLINEFTTPYVRATNFGYYLSTLEVALTHLCSMGGPDYKPGESSKLGSLLEVTYSRNNLSLNIQYYEDPMLDLFKQVEQPTLYF